MKYLFIVLFFYMIFKLLLSKNFENKFAFITITLVAVIAGIVNLVYEPSLADIIKGWG